MTLRAWDVVSLMTSLIQDIKPHCIYPYGHLCNCNDFSIEFQFYGAYVCINSYHLIFVSTCECVWVQKPGCPQATAVGGKQEA